MTTATTAANPHASECVTEGVRVRAEPRYLAERSDPANGKWLFGSRIRITNEREAPIRVEGRRWRIVDADGSAHEVEGLGVIGRQPEIAPGETFEYASYAPLASEWGTMEGAYRIAAGSDESFEAPVSRFYLVGRRD